MSKDPNISFDTNPYRNPEPVEADPTEKEIEFWCQMYIAVETSGLVWTNDARGEMTAVQVADKGLAARRKRFGVK